MPLRFGSPPGLRLTWQSQHSHVNKPYHGVRGFLPPVTLREYVFKTTSSHNLLCQFTRDHPKSWILIHLLRPNTRGPAQGAVFTLHAPQADVDRFLVEEFGKRYGTYEVIFQGPDLTSVEVTNYILPAYRGADPVEMATKMLGRDSFFTPILVVDGYIHIKVVAAPPAAGKNFTELLKRMTAVTHPEDFKLIHTGEFDPLQRLRPRDDAISPRQLEVLKLAVELGYYDDPRKSTLEDIARAFGVSKAAVHKRLLAAETKIIKNSLV